MTEAEQAGNPWCPGVERSAAVFLDYSDTVFGTRRKQEFQALFDKIVSFGPVRSQPRHGPEAPREG